jgi:hypothetical protein
LIAAALTANLAAARIERSGDCAVYALAIDAHNVHPMTEPMLDAWWANLTPEQKGEIYDRDLGTDASYVEMGLRTTGLAAMVDHINATAAQFDETYNRPFRGHAAHHDATQEALSAHC